MKLNLCDICASEKKLVLAKYRTKHKNGVAVESCVAHRNWANDKTPEDYLNLILKAEEVIRGMESGKQ